MQEKHLKIQGTVSRKTHLIREWLKSTSPSFLKRSKGGSLKKLPEEFSRTKSLILGALSKLDEFLLRPQVRTCSVAVPGTSRNSGSENREPTGDSSLGDPCPEAVFSTYHSSNLNDSEQEETHHMVTWVQEKIPYQSRKRLITAITNHIDDILCCAIAKTLFEFKYIYHIFSLKMQNFSYSIFSVSDRNRKFQNIMTFFFISKCW